MDKRPINLDLLSMRFPPMAIASILHRVSGILLFLLLPGMLYLLDISLRSSDTFAHMQMMIHTGIWQILLWLFGSALIYHGIAGIRHFLLDVGIGEHLPAARHSATAVIILSLILMVFLGIRLW